jgi:creatinine amidohydrolase
MKSVLIKIIFALLVCASLMTVAPAYANSSSVYMQELTSQEIQARLRSGTKIAIVPTGATEQQGPQMATGKSNMVVRYAAGEIAKRLGNTLVTPVMPFAPSGRITPPEGNMQFAGTISISPRAYSLALADVVRSLKQHGFTMICLIGDSQASQAMQAQVASTLSSEWTSAGVKVVNISHYYSKNGQDDWHNSSGVKVANPAAHGGHIATSELMSVDDSAVRSGLLANRSENDYRSTGASGDSSQATAMLGNRYVSLKIEAAVNQIQNASSRAQ